MTPSKRDRRDDEAGQEIDIEVCCDALYESIESGGVKVVESAPGVYCEAIPSADGKSGMIINFCPFCGSARAALDEIEDESAGSR